MSCARRASSAFARRRLGVVPEARVRQAELVRARGERGRERLERRAARARRASRRARRRARSTARARRGPTGRACTRRSAAFRCASAARYSCGAPARAGKTRPSTRSKYARRAAGPALDDREPVRREDERRELAAQRLRRRQPRAVQPRLLRLALAQRHRCLDRRRRRGVPPPTTRAAVSPKRISCAVVTRARREALRREVQRLEQVRLADTVSADDQHDPGREVEVERRVRPVLAERYAIDDQPARRIGMIRYT